MPITLIQQNPQFNKLVEGGDKLAIAEMFADTIQGEGVNTGESATFIRMQGCTLKCSFCDTLNVWPYGNEYSFEEIFSLLEKIGIDKYRQGQHLIFTGGSPLKQQARITQFLIQFFQKYMFYPYIEIENETVLMPNVFLTSEVHCWNNSPKLSNSAMRKEVRVKPQVLSFMSQLQNSWFKFVVSKEKDWNEIEEDFLPHILKTQVILMPEGQTQEQLSKTRELVANMAIKNNVRFTDRLHITIWNKKTGV